MMLDLKLRVELNDHYIVEIGTILFDDPFRDAITIDQVVFDEPGNHIFVTEANEDASTHFIK